ncbi:MAG: lasso peptide biosynthesis B2 protein [Gemmatimonadales bacterium]
MLRLLRRFFELSGAERRLILRAVCLVVGVRLGLSLLPSRVLLRQVNRHLGAAGPKPSIAPLPPDRIAWAVRVASRRVPHATCLTQALAAQLLLDHYGYPSRLHLGVARGKQGEFQAHAWVESGGLVVVGGQELDRYSQLPDLEKISR